MFPILIVFIFIIKNAFTTNLTYIIRKETDRMQPICVVEDGSVNKAVGWIYPIPSDKNNLPNITTKYIPTIRNEYDCKFSQYDKCMKLWTIKNWQINDKSVNINDFVVDERWEDLPLIYTADHAFADGIEISSAFSLGYSLRTSGDAEIFVCEGWTPRNYPCYRLVMTKTNVTLHRLDSLSHNQTGPIDSFKTHSTILSEDEWRNFVVDLDKAGRLRLVDANTRMMMLEFKDEKPLNACYFLIKSSRPTLWKIHQNQYLYTMSPQISRFGPSLDISSKNLCVSLYVLTCRNCEMVFFLMEYGVKQILAISHSQNRWESIRLESINLSGEKINLFVETKFIRDSGDQAEGFWAFDDVRMCHENEIRVSLLKSVADFGDDIDKVSCQLVESAKWRPKRQFFENINDLPTPTAITNDTSITLSWPSTEINRINYFITYKANDLCISEPHNMDRIKSNGFLSTKKDEITINNLIPFTRYNITFTTVLNENQKELSINTLETDLPTLQEIPNNIQIQVTDNSAQISWDKINCELIYGKLKYAIEVINKLKNITESLILHDKNFIELNNLEPYTFYQLKISTFRNFKNRTIDITMDFKTKAKVAPAVENLELYSIDKQSANLRYDLPKTPQGKPLYVELKRCNHLLMKKCKSFTSILNRCKLWPRKYCVEISNLAPFKMYTFKISLKNENTNQFGPEREVDGYTNDRVPNKPLNITYKVDCQDNLDYCHLNISWLHPYYPNSTITAFGIILNETNSNRNETESIHEMLKLDDKTYSQRYSYQIKFISYSKTYQLYVQSINQQFKSDFNRIQVKTPNVGDHIDQAPKILEKTADSLTFGIPHVDNRLDFYNLTVILQDYNETVELDPKLRENKKIYNNLCHQFGDSRITHSLKITNGTLKNITIDNLNPDTHYCVIFIVTNRYKNSDHDKIYYEKLDTLFTIKNSSYNNSHLYVLFLLLLLVPIGFLVYRFLGKKKQTRQLAHENVENVYESVPFEECDANYIDNKTYDLLVHK